jgi:hypothetical protein
METLSIFLDIPNKFWDQNIMDLIHGIQIQLGSGEFISIAKEIAAVLSLIYLSVKAYSMILGEGRLEIMQLFRPFVITLVIVNFGLYANIAGSLGNAAAATEEGLFQANASHMDDLMFTKDSLSTTFWTRVLDSTSQIRNQLSEQDNANSDKVIDAGDPNWIVGGVSKAVAHAQNAIGSYITIYEQLAWAKLSMWLQSLIESIAFSIFKGVAYCLFFIQMILMHILLIIGPISFALSIIGAFRDSWVQWTARYIAVSFYTAIGMIVLNMAILIISYGMQQEISRMQQILDNALGTDFYQSVIHIDNFLGYLLIGLLVAIGGIMTVPAVSGWIVGGGGSAGSVMHGTGVASAKLGGRLASGVASGKINAVRSGFKPTRNL